MPSVAMQVGRVDDWFLSWTLTPADGSCLSTRVSECRFNNSSWHFSRIKCRDNY
jgi:hypothetical protein